MAFKDISPRFDQRDISRFSYEPEPVNQQLIAELKEARSRVEAAALARGLDAETGTVDECPPPSNTGGNQNTRFVWVNGKAVEWLERRGHDGNGGFIDWLNFTVHESSFNRRNIVITDADLILNVSAFCSRFFGFGITRVRATGLNFYTRSYVLGDDYGFVCYGGQRNTVLIVLNGEGCAAAKPGWEERLYKWLRSHREDGKLNLSGAADARITRIDVAFDDFDGDTLSPEIMEHWYDAGLFKASSAGRNPNCELRGNWKSPDDHGRTIYIGNRGNGKFCRGYEKGKQLGDPVSPWFRVEVEFKSVDRFIPFEILIHPGSYLAGAYPALHFLRDRQERILTKQKTVQASYERTKNWLKHQCGSALNFMLEVEGSPEKVLELVKREGKTPRGLTVPDYRNSPEPLHRHQSVQVPFDSMD